MSEKELLPLTIDVGRVLAVAAHPDDLEYDASAAVAIWTRLGHEVAYCLATRGEAGIDGMEPGQSGGVRAGEQLASASQVGVEHVQFLNYPDGLVEQSIGLRRDLARAIRRFRPDTLLLTNHRETWPSGTLNSPDHRNVGQSALDALGDAGNRWIFRELADDEGLDPHHVRYALIADSPRATHGLDVAQSVDTAVASLAEHRAYLRGLGDHRMANPEYVRESLQRVGQRLDGSAAAVMFELFEF